MRINFTNIFALLFLLLTHANTAVKAQVPDSIVATPRSSTSPVIFDADDPAIWIHPANPAQSLIIGTDKGTYPEGGIFVWNMDGTPQQRLNISHPNNVDVRYGMPLAGSAIDIAVVTMRDHRQIRIYKIDSSSRTLEEITTRDNANVVYHMFKSPQGLGLYQRPKDRTVFAIASSVHNESRRELWQVLLQDDGTGCVEGVLVRVFGDHTGQVEGLVADDELGYLYVAEEKAGIHKYHADPRKGNDRLAFFATADGITGNREGLALYSCADSTGYLLLSVPSARAIKVYPRAGNHGNPHAHALLTTIMNTSSEFGDGLEVTNRRISMEFPHGVLIWHHQAGKQFRLYAWEDLAQNFLATCTISGVPTRIERNFEEAGIETFELQQNYPNPFNPETEIRFRLPKASRVQLVIYDLNGAEVKVLLQQNLPAGLHDARWEGNDREHRPVASGIYFYKLETGEFSKIRKMTLLR